MCRNTLLCRASTILTQVAKWTRGKPVFSIHFTNVGFSHEGNMVDLHFFTSSHFPVLRVVIYGMVANLDSFFTVWV